MSPPVARGVLTTAMVAALTSDLASSPGEDILVGRGIAPQAGGWTQGQPGVGAFKPYVTVKTGVAQPAVNQRDPLGMDNASWMVGYLLTSVGINDAHVDDVADKVRAALAAWSASGLRAVTLRSVSWRLDRVQFSSLGGSAPNNSTDPPYWEITDTVGLWLARSRS